jgi:hypothetical protein
MLFARAARHPWAVALLVLIVLPVGAAAQAADNTDLERRAEAERILRTYLDGWETGDAALFERVLSPHFVDYMYGQLRTREALLQQATAPRLLRNRAAIDDLILDGDLAVVRTTNHFTHPESGRTATMTGMIIARIADGMMVEGWGVHDRLGLFQQLEVLPKGEELSALLRKQLRQP